MLLAIRVAGDIVLHVFKNIGVELPAPRGSWSKNEARTDSPSPPPFFLDCETRAIAIRCRIDLRMRSTYSPMARPLTAPSLATELQNPVASSSLPAGFLVEAFVTQMFSISRADFQPGRTDPNG